MEIKENEKIIVVDIYRKLDCYRASFGKDGFEKSTIRGCLEEIFERIKVKEYQLVPTETYNGSVVDLLLLLKVEKEQEDIPLL
jgi:hypothetical protein